MRATIKSAIVLLALVLGGCVTTQSTATPPIDMGAAPAVSPSRLAEICEHFKDGMVYSGDLDLGYRFVSIEVTYGGCKVWRQKTKEGQSIVEILVRKWQLQGSAPEKEFAQTWAVISNDVLYWLNPRPEPNLRGKVIQLVGKNYTEQRILGSGNGRPTMIKRRER
ncbi:MAG: hypothetical protein KIT25_03920 [Enhydrobacter sp.]|nr:MAG: hypothetical protein KIT25_03920 [Enhydrobacter sp.]